jgi:hypothetical protein
MAGRRFLYPTDGEDLTGGHLAHLGFTMTVRLGDRKGWTMNLNVNCTCAGLIHLIVEVYGGYALEATPTLPTMSLKF